MDLILARKTAVTPWQPRQARRDPTMEVQSVSLTTVTVTRARPVERPRPHEPEVRTYEWTKTHGRAYATRRDVERPAGHPESRTRQEATAPGADARAATVPPRDAFIDSAGWHDDAFGFDTRSPDPIDRAGWGRDAYEPTGWHDRIEPAERGRVDRSEGPDPDLEDPEAILERIARRYYDKRAPEPGASWRHAPLTPLPTEGYLTLREAGPLPVSMALESRRAIAAFERHREAS